MLCRTHARIKSSGYSSSSQIGNYNTATPSPRPPLKRLFPFALGSRLRSLRLLVGVTPISRVTVAGDFLAYYADLIASLAGGSVEDRWFPFVFHGFTPLGAAGGLLGGDAVARRVSLQSEEDTQGIYAPVRPFLFPYRPEVSAIAPIPHRLPLETLSSRSLIVFGLA
ncbi:hypothetical protein ZIOFF_027046 [Zingiber officinale]|uniref:Uncharacterized protein n=1 Tax=Zingiber officinale TaxID=94328 RepID=A0A8J5H7H4_ZINOF|nr:hypothetical protein ZIOFF_027046 [Zingiber officinale]